MAKYKNIIMDRRKAVKTMAGAIAIGGAGYLGLTNLFKPKIPEVSLPKKIDFTPKETDWQYTPLNPEITSQVAYDNYKNGSCMYGVFTGIVLQLAEKLGEPWSSFPTHMMKYGHGGVGGTGTICGSLNGASAIFGLLIDNQEIRDALTFSLFNWYENAALPSFKPLHPIYDFTPSTAISKSVLCHASGTTWCIENGFTMSSDERKERCRRLTADVAAQTVEILNSYFSNTFMTTPSEQNVENCLSCHASSGKIDNASAKMNCTSCHDESIGHKVFGDIHYKLMNPN